METRVRERVSAVSGRRSCVLQDAAPHVQSINGLPGMFDQNKDLVSEIHQAPL